MIEPALGSNLAAIDVDGVANGFKCVERNADGQDDLEHGERSRRPHRIQRIAERIQEELCVLEVTQNAEIDAHADQHEQDRDPPRRGPLDAVSKQPIQRGRADNQQCQAKVPGGVEIEARGQEQPDAGSRPGDRPVHREDDDEEGQKLLCTEEHDVLSTSRPASGARRGIRTCRTSVTYPF